MRAVRLAGVNSCRVETGCAMTLASVLECSLRDDVWEISAHNTYRRVDGLVKLSSFATQVNNSARLKKLRSGYYKRGQTISVEELSSALETSQSSWRAIEEGYVKAGIDAASLPRTLDERYALYRFWEKLGVAWDELPAAAKIWESLRSKRASLKEFMVEQRAVRRSKNAKLEMVRLLEKERETLVALDVDVSDLMSSGDTVALLEERASQAEIRRRFLRDDDDEEYFTKGELRMSLRKFDSTMTLDGVEGEPWPSEISRETNLFWKRQSLSVVQQGLWRKADILKAVDEYKLDITNRLVPKRRARRTDQPLHLAIRLTPTAVKKTRRRSSSLSRLSNWFRLSFTPRKTENETDV